MGEGKMANVFTFWAYNSDSGAVQEMERATGMLLLSTGSGWHGPFDSKQAALDYYTANAPNNPGWKAPSGLGQNLSNAVSSDIQAVTDPLGKANLGGWFVRIGEILLGLILVGVGVAKLTGTGNVVSELVKAKIP